MTRATIHFRDGDGLTRAIVYRHCDGYPEGLGKDLEEFFDELSLFVKDHRFWDAEYLAAKWVVWDSRRYSEGHPCDFLSVGIMLRDPADIAYRYVVRCGSDRPVVSVS